MGDRIVAVDGQDEFDPLKLPSICLANAGQPMTFSVERDAAVASARRYP